MVIRVELNPILTGIPIKMRNVGPGTDIHKGKTMQRHVRKKMTAWLNWCIYKTRSAKDYWEIPQIRRGKKGFSPRAIRERVSP